MSTDDEVLGRISSLVEEEHTLRGKRERNEIAGEDERRRLDALEVELDRCWDLLRQRRARRAAGQDPDSTSTRPGDQVEGYLG